jgi:hypothetical protein
MLGDELDELDLAPGPIGAPDPREKPAAVIVEQREDLVFITSQRRLPSGNR